MKQRALVFIKPQMPDNFISVYMEERLSIIELDQWVTQMWLEHGIMLLPSNNNRTIINHGRLYGGPDTAA